MIIKLQLPTNTTTARQQSLKVVQPLTFKDRVKADRIAVAIIYLLGVIGAVVFA